MLQVQAKRQHATQATLISASTRRGAVIEPVQESFETAISDAGGLIQKHRARRGVTTSISPSRNPCPELLRGNLRFDQGSRGRIVAGLGASWAISSSRAIGPTTMARLSCATSAGAARAARRRGA
jgi:hypothetical protein